MQKEVIIHFIKNAKNNLLSLKKLKNTESAQLCNKIICKKERVDFFTLTIVIFRNEWVKKVSF